MIFTGATQDEVWPLVRDFHYSKRMPSAIKHCFAWRQPGGLFGDTGELNAGIIYGQPVGRNWPHDALELQRLVRRDDFPKQLSKLVSWSLRWLRNHTTTPFVLSYADSDEGHHGGIYQATGFYFVGRSQSSSHQGFNDTNGGFVHARSVYSRFGTSSIPKINIIKPDWSPVFCEPKYIYIRPLRQRLKPLLRRFDWKVLPFPKPDNAARLLDAPEPTGVSQEHTLGAAPNA